MQERYHGRGRNNPSKGKRRDGCIPADHMTASRQDPIFPTCGLAVPDPDSSNNIIVSPVLIRPYVALAAWVFKWRLILTAGSAIASRV